MSTAPSPRLTVEPEALASPIRKSDPTLKLPVMARLDVVLVPTWTVGTVRE